MKRIFCFLLVLLTTLSLCACEKEPEQPEQPESHGLQIGFAREDVMPQKGTPILEGTAPNRVMTEYVDILTVTCVAIRGENEETVLLYTADRIRTDDGWGKSTRKVISEGTGIPQDRIMLASTHTHSAPKFSGWEGASEYLAYFQNKMVKAGQDALQDLTPSETYIGSTEAEGLAFVRHYKLADGSVTSSGIDAGSPLIVGHAAENDEELQIVRFARENGKKDVILMSFTAHPAFYASVDSTTMSADFPGPTRDYIESKGDYLVAYFIGAAGNQEQRTKYAPEMAAAPKDYHEYARRLGDYLLAALPNLTKAEGNAVTVSGQHYQAKTNKEKLDMLEPAKEVMEVFNTEGRDAANRLASQYGLYQYLEAQSITRRAEYADTNEVWLNVMSIGENLSFAFAPYEMFCENGSYLRANTPYDMTFLVTCSNGAEGYLPSKVACEYRCYEYYTTLFEVGTAEILIDEFLSMLNAIKNG